MIKKGIIVGRFQVPFLHDAHLSLIKRALDENDKVLILLGCLEKKPSDFLKYTNYQDNSNDSNVFSFHHRQETILVHFKNYKNRILILPIYDLNSDKDWDYSLDNMIDLFSYAHKHKIADVDVTLYGGRDSFLKTYNGKYINKTKLLDLNSDSSGTDVREKYLKVIE